MKPYLVSSALVLVGSTLIACGGGSEGGSSLAGGGISGTGSGTITAFGSIFLNGTGHFQTDSSDVEIDGEMRSINELDLGMVAEVDVSNSDSLLATGDADRIRIIHEVKGPVTSLAPLAVLGQTVVVNANSVLQSDSDPRPATGTVDPATVSTFSATDLTLGEELEISGRRDDKGVIQVSRVERKTSLNKWQLIGRISGLDTLGQTFSIGSQSIDYSGVSPEDCDSGLSNDLRVEIKATPVVGFVAGNTLTASKVECKPDQLNFGGSATGSVLAEMEGFVTSEVTVSDSTNSFNLGDQEVHFTSTTQFEGGTSADIVPGVKLDARGTYDLLSKILDANRIRFRQSRFRIEAPAAAFSSGSVNVLGLTVNTNAATEDDDNLLSGSALPQIEVRGYVDSDGSLIADEVEEEDETPDANDVRVRGRVASGSVTGSAANFTFTLFGGQLVIDGASAVEFKINDLIVSRDAFFAKLNDNVEVDVDRASFNGLNTLTNGKLEIDND